MLVARFCHYFLYQKDSTIVLTLLWFWLFMQLFRSDQYSISCQGNSGSFFQNSQLCLRTTEEDLFAVV